MAISRRAFLASTAVGVSAMTSSCTTPQAERSSPAAATSTLPATDRWAQVRSEFDLSDEYVHMSALLMASHPRGVREGVERYRREPDVALGGVRALA
jgi:hypothetical protein